jgi:hypothetical protein
MSNATQSMIQSNSPSLSTEKRKPNTRPSSQGFPKRTGTSKRNNGKSKFAQKSRVNANRKPIAVKPRGPVFSYVSVCCNVPATKKPCVAVSKKDALTQTLGKFRCTGCQKPAKVSRSKYVAPEAAIVTEVPVV